MRYRFGRCAYGISAAGSGVCALVWHNVGAVIAVPHRAIFITIVAAILIIGGIALLWPSTVKAGAASVGLVFIVFALLGVPLIVKHPLVYNGYGNFFEQFSFVSAALMVCSGTRRTAARPNALARFGYYSFGVCVISLGLEQLFYIRATATLVPKWIPPGQLFWAWATTFAFAAAGIALLAKRRAKLAAHMTAGMIVCFGVLVWLPLLFANPHQFANWSETLETFGIAASAWIVAEYAR